MNEAVVKYQNGDEEARDFIFKAVSPMIEKASLEVERFVDEFVIFDYTALKEIERLANSYDFENHDFFSSAKTVVNRLKARYIKRNSRRAEMYVSMNAMEDSTKDRDGLGYQFTDPLARVEDEVMVKEKITLLAQGDLRRKLILEYWSQGINNDKHISELLAQRIGGNSETHRKFIMRFRDKCKKRLKAMGIVYPAKKQ